ncbi:MAG: RNA polymerase sigma factor, partial [Bacteroidales bacterium]
MHEPKSTITNKQLESWIDEHSSFLLNRAYSLLSVKEDAEDVVQEVFLSLYQSADSFEGRSSVRTWLTAVLHNKIADLY